MDERFRIHEQNRPAFPKPAWYDLRTMLIDLRKEIVEKIEFNEELPTAPPTLWDKLITAVMEWALTPRINKVDRASPPYEA